MIPPLGKFDRGAYKSLPEALDALEEAEGELRDIREESFELEAENERLQTEVQQWENADEAPPAVLRIMAMPSLDRDAFLADLCRECALLGVEWPASPRAETQRYTIAELAHLREIPAVEKKRRAQSETTAIRREEQ